MGDPKEGTPGFTALCEIFSSYQWNLIGTLLLLFEISQEQRVTDEIAGYSRNKKKHDQLYRDSRSGSVLQHVIVFKRNRAKYKFKGFV